MPSEQSPEICAAVKVPAVLRIFIGELLQEQRAGKSMTWTKLLLTAATRNQSLLLPIRGLIGEWILNPWRIAFSRKFPAAVNGAVIQSQAKAELTVAGISVMRESAVWEEKYNASIFMQGLNSIWDLEENKNFK